MDLYLIRMSAPKFATEPIGRAFAAEFINSSAANGVVYLENAAMKQRSRELAKSGSMIPRA
jgi:hypothetical protein